MFYSHTHLRRNGRFGLIWLAATQAKVLTKRELCAVNITLACSDILTFIPDVQEKGRQYGGHRRRGFSLYLSSQLLYGSSKILEKQMDYLLADAWALFRKCCPEGSTIAIDLVVNRPEPTTLECLVPSGVCDKNFDFGFGTCKQQSEDIEHLLEQFEQSLLRNVIQMTPIPNPVLITDEMMRSPNTVANRSIQIEDVEGRPQDGLLMPGEQDLPPLDLANLTLISEGLPDDQLYMPDPIVARAENIADVPEGQPRLDGDPQTDLTQNNMSRLPPQEQTPAPADPQLPPTPHKVKRPRGKQGGEEGRKRRKPEGQDHRESSSQGDVSGSQGEGDVPVGGTEVIGQGAEVTSQAVEVTSQEMEITGQGAGVQEIAQPQQPGPSDQTQEEDQPRWGEAPMLQLDAQATASPSPARRRRIRKLIVDASLQISRDERKKALKEGQTTCTNMNQMLAKPRLIKDVLKHPGSQAIDNPLLKSFWQSNCVFGLRCEDVYSDIDSLSSSLTLSDHNTTRQRSDPEEQFRAPLVPLQTPSDRPTDQLIQPVTAEISVEGERDESVRSTERRNRSSLLPVRDDSRTKTPVPDDANKSVSDQGSILNTSYMPPNMPPITEHPQDLHLAQDQPPMSPVVEIPQDVARQLSFEERPAPRPGTAEEVLRRIRAQMRSADDWTTFRQTWPPSSTTRPEAADALAHIIALVGKEKLKTRQDQPYDEIFLWTVMRH